MLLLLLFLAVVPIIAYRIARKRYPNSAFVITGIAFGSVIAPLSLGLYATFFIPYVGLVPGMLGLMLVMFHGAPGYSLALTFGLIPPGQVVEGVGHIYLAVLGGIVWATAYGCLGWMVDWYRAKKGGKKLHARG